MSPLESLFRLEIEFHRCLRALPTDPLGTAGLHTSYALQAGYEPLLSRLGTVTVRDLDHLERQFLTTVNPRDVLAAATSLKQLLGIP